MAYVAVAVDDADEIVAERVVREDATEETAAAYARLMPVAYAHRGATGWALWTVEALRDHRLNRENMRRRQAR